MRQIASVLGICAALVLCTVSAAMNYLFLASLGKTPLEGQVLGTASAAADLLKALLPFFIAWSWQARRFVAAASGTAAFVFFAGFSLLSALGFAAETRGTLVQSREEAHAAYVRMLRDLNETAEKRRSLPDGRPAGVVSEDIARHQQDRRWSATKACTEATQTESRAYCAAYFTLRSELAAAEEAQRLSAEMARLQSQADSLRATGAGQESDPQVALLSRIFGAEREPVRLALTVLIAILVEIGASLGLFLASGHGAAKQIPVSEPEEPGPLPPSEAAPRMVGDIEDFVLEALVPMPGTSLSLSELQAAYADWCAASDLEPLPAQTFAERFAALAKVVGVPSGRNGYSGIGPKSRQRMAA